MFVRIMVFWFASIGAALLAQAGDPLFFTAEDGHKQFGTGYVYDAAYSPTADEIAVLTNRGLFVLSAETHELLRHRLLSEDFRFLKYSPDGTLIVLVGSLIQNDADVALRKTKYPIVNATRMGIVDVDSLSFVKKVNQSVRLPFYGDSYADFVGVWFSNLSKSNLYNLLKHPNYLNFSSDSRYFAAQSDNNVFVYDAATGELVKNFDISERVSEDLKKSEMIKFADNNRSLWVFSFYGDYILTIDLASGGMSEIGLDTFATSPVESIHDGEYYLRVDGVLSTQIGGRLTTSVLDKNGNGIKQLANDTSGPWYFVDAVRFGIASDNTLIVNSEKVNRKFSIGDFELLEEHSAPPARFGSPFNQTGEKFVTPSGNNVLEIESFGENSTEVLSNFYDIKAAQGVDPQTIMISEPSLIKWFDLDEGIIRSRLPIESPSRFVYVKNLNLLIAFRYIINQTGLVYDVNTGEQVGTQDWPELPWSNLHLIDDEHVIVAAAEKIVFAHTIESNQTIWQASTPKNLYLRSFMTDVNPRDTNYACIYAVLNTEPTQYKMLEYTIYSDEVPVVCNLDFVPALLKYIDDETILILSSEGDVYLVENGEISLYINTGVKIEDRTVKVISPDGKWLVLDDEIWDLQNKTQIPDLSHEVGSFEIAGFTADGEKIFFVHADDTISVWDVDRLTGMTSTVKNSIEYK